MAFPAHALPFAGALFLLITLLAMNVTRLRVGVRVTLGDGGDRRLGRAIRAHGNALEHGLLLSVALVLAEATGLSAARVVGLGWAILIARLVHAAGFLRLGTRVVQAAMVVTYAMELWLSVYLLSRAFHSGP
ncbi:MAG: MAPEG family protein [Myxococcaceae bacterium]